MSPKLKITWLGQASATDTPVELGESPVESAHVTRSAGSAHTWQVRQRPSFPPFFAGPALAWCLPLIYSGWLTMHLQLLLIPAMHCENHLAWLNAAFVWAAAVAAAIPVETSFQAR